eukprot:CAMPEP_0170623394 /NCGR_PEP_ID=MMETSP0224-20130122/29675_1 /TAXON_ID=285029 /ORGANISM="Togula jolla, Strain CCCM 725" /LENGTH=248 /DNA_ID=CAMNT_0010949845 /DNA_START=299 /DNA_END=1046 /DNA_ORIENTATION=-
MTGPRFAGTLHWPQPLLPKHTSVPSTFTAQVCSNPAATAFTGPRPGGTSHWPLPFAPKHTIQRPIHQDDTRMIGACGNSLDSAKVRRHIALPLLICSKAHERPVKLHGTGSSAPCSNSGNGTKIFWHCAFPSKVSSKTDEPLFNCHNACMPASNDTAATGPSSAGTVHCPMLLSPTHTTVPSRFTTHVWNMPAATAITGPMSLGISSCPSEDLPYVSSVPSAFTTQVCATPAATDCLGGGSAKSGGMK